MLLPANALLSETENVPWKSRSKPSFPHRAHSWAEIKFHDIPERFLPLAKAIQSCEEGLGGLGRRRTRQIKKPVRFKKTCLGGQLEWFTLFRIFRSQQDHLQ